MAARWRRAPALSAMLVLIVGACGSGNGDDPPRSAKSRTDSGGFSSRLAQISASPVMAQRLLGFDATDSGVDSKPCHDSFDGGEPRTWVRFSLRSRAADGVVALAERARRDGWNQVGSSTSDGLTETTFAKDFDNWSGQLTVSVGSGTELSSVIGADVEVRGQIASETYCTPS